MSRSKTGWVHKIIGYILFSQYLSPPWSINGYRQIIQGAQDSYCSYLMLQKLQLGADTNELSRSSDPLTGMDFLLYTEVYLHVWSEDINHTIHIHVQ